MSSNQRLEKDTNERWWKRVRRAFNVPDLVGDEMARRIIIEELAAPDRVKRLAIAGAVVTAVSEVGPTGQLDEHLVAEEVRKRLQAGVLPDVRRGGITAVHEHAMSHLALQGDHRTEEARKDVSTLTADLLAKIAGHLAAWPFEDSGDHYFRTRPTPI